MPITPTTWRSSRRPGPPRWWQALRRRWSGQLGQTLAEYALLLGGTMVAVLLVTLLLFRDNITTAFSSAADCVQGACLTEAPPDDGGDSAAGGEAGSEDGEQADRDDPRTNDHCGDGRGSDAGQRACRR